MPKQNLRCCRQNDRFSSPWTLTHRLCAGLWTITWLLLFRPTPKPLSRWRVLLLRIFGCHVTGRPFVDASAIVKYPWKLTLEDKACIGPHAELYNLGLVKLGRNAVVAQHAYLCGGTHNFTSEKMELMVGDIQIDEDAFVGAKAIVLPGVRVGVRAIVGAGSVVTKDVPDGQIWAGNPAKFVKPRQLLD